MFSHIVVPLDGSKLAETSLGELGKMALPEDHTITLVTVLDPLVGRHFEDYAAAERLSITEAIDYYLEAVARDLTLPGRTVNTLQLAAVDAAEGILDAVDQMDPSAVVLTSHGRSGARRWMLGSVAEKLVRALDRPLVIVPAR